MMTLNVISKRGYRDHARYRNFRTSRSSGDRRDSITKRAAGIVVAAPTSASVSPALRLVRLFSPRLASRATPAPIIARVLTMKNSFGRVSDRRFMVVFSGRFVCNSHDESLRAEHGSVEPAVALAANGVKVVARLRLGLQRSGWPGSLLNSSTARKTSRYACFIAIGHHDTDTY
jgi:hypothetical protein